MNLIKFFVLAFAAVTLTSCASQQKTLNTANNQNQQVQNDEGDDPTMVNVINAARLPATAGSMTLGKTDIPVHVEAQLQKNPGDEVQYGSIVFYVKSNRRIAGIINGNSAGSETSKKFITVVNKIMNEGAKPAVTAAIAAAQAKLKALEKTQAAGDLTEETFISIRKILTDTNRTILAAY